MFWEWVFLIWIFLMAFLVCLIIHVFWNDPLIFASSYVLAIGFIAIFLVFFTIITFFFSTTIIFSFFIIAILAIFSTLAFTLPWLFINFRGGLRKLLKEVYCHLYSMVDHHQFLEDQVSMGLDLFLVEVQKDQLIVEVQWEAFQMVEADLVLVDLSSMVAHLLLNLVGFHRLAFSKEHS
jgi:hypothetical protein